MNNSKKIKFLSLASFLILTVGCKLGSDFSVVANLPPSTPPIVPVDVEGVVENEEVSIGKSVTLSGKCEPGYVVSVEGSALDMPYSTSCDSNGQYSVPVQLAASANATAELVVSQVVNGTESKVTTILNLVAYCGDAQIVACAVSGTGSATAPYQISSLDCLQKMELGKACHYKQIANIDASVTTTWNGGAGWIPVGRFGSSFSGTYDGQGYRVSNLYINYTGQDLYEVGFFGATGNATIRNIHLENVNVYGDNVGDRGVAAIVGWASHTLIENAIVSGQVEGGVLVAGLVARAEFLTLRNAKANMTVLGNVNGEKIGGLLGSAYELNLERSSFAGSVSTGNSTVMWGPRLGGLAYNVYIGNVSDFYFSGNILATASTTGSIEVGGFSYAFEQASVTRSYFSGTIDMSASSGGSNAGGLFYYLGDSIASQSFVAATINVSSSYGALINNTGGTTELNTIVWYQPGAYPAFASGGVTTSTAVSSEGALGYFYDVNNSPMNLWNTTTVWQSVPANFPTLK